MTPVFHSEAEQELADAVSYYDCARAGLGDEFLAVVESRVSEATHDPASWPEISSGVRRIRIPRFPFDLIFAETAQGLVVLAVMHHHRRPGYWSDRIEDAGTRQGPA